MFNTCSIILIGWRSRFSLQFPPTTCLDKIDEVSGGGCGQYLWCMASRKNTLLSIHPFIFPGDQITSEKLVPKLCKKQPPSYHLIHDLQLALGHFEAGSGGWREGFSANVLFLFRRLSNILALFSNRFGWPCNSRLMMLQGWKHDFLPLNLDKVLHFWHISSFVNAFDWLKQIAPMLLADHSLLEIIGLPKHGCVAMLAIIWTASSLSGGGISKSIQKIQNSNFNANIQMGSRGQASHTFRQVDKILLESRKRFLCRHQWVLNVLTKLYFPSNLCLLPES